MLCEGFAYEIECKGCVMQPRTLCNFGVISTISVDAIFDGAFRIPGCLAVKHSLQKRFFYPPLFPSTAVIFNIKIQNPTCVPFRKSQIRERGTLIGESEKFSSSKGEKSYGRLREGGRNFPNNAALPDWLFLPTSERFFFEAKRPPPS